MCWISLDTIDLATQVYEKMLIPKKLATPSNSLPRFVPQYRPNPSSSSSSSSITVAPPSIARNSNLESSKTVETPLNNKPEQLENVDLNIEKTLSETIRPSFTPKLQSLGDKNILNQEREDIEAEEEITADDFFSTIQENRQVKRQKMSGVVGGEERKTERINPPHPREAALPTIPLPNPNSSSSHRKKNGEEGKEEAHEEVSAMEIVENSEEEEESRGKKKGRPNKSKAKVTTNTKSKTKTVKRVNVSQLLMNAEEDESEYEEEEEEEDTEAGKSKNAAITKIATAVSMEAENKKKRKRKSKANELTTTIEPSSSSSSSSLPKTTQSHLLSLSSSSLTFQQRKKPLFPLSYLQFIHYPLPSDLQDVQLGGTDASSDQEDIQSKLLALNISHKRIVTHLRLSLNGISGIHFTDYENRAVITGIHPISYKQSPNGKYSLEVGDLILSVNNLDAKYSNFNQLMTAIHHINEPWDESTTLSSSSSGENNTNNSSNSNANSSSMNSTTSNIYINDMNHPNYHSNRTVLKNAIIDSMASITFARVTLK